MDETHTLRDHSSQSLRRFLYPERDLEEIFQNTKVHWDELGESRVLITGAQGFVGSWISEALRYILTRKGIGPGVVSFIGDIRSQDATWMVGSATHVIHAAAKTDDELWISDPISCVDSVIRGTANMIAVSKKAQVERFLYLSSGAVYSKGVGLMSEIDLLDHDPKKKESAYPLSKLLAENICLSSATATFNPMVARLFSFLGPGLPLDKHFAAGNFISDALEKDEITIKGDGKAIRSYLYPTDLVSWLLTILFRGQGKKIYNVGSENIIPLYSEESSLPFHDEEPSLTQEISKQSGKPIKILGEKTQKRSYYAPSVDKIEKELGMRQTVSLSEAVKRTLEYYKEKKDKKE